MLSMLRISHLRRSDHPPKIGPREAPNEPMHKETWSDGLQPNSGGLQPKRNCIRSWFDIGIPRYEKNSKNPGNRRQSGDITNTV